MSIRELFQDLVLPNYMVLFENFVKLLANEPIYRATYAHDAVIVKRLRTDPQYSELFQAIDASDPHLTPAIVRQYTTQLRDILIQMNGIMGIGNGGPIRATWHRLCQQLQLPRQEYRIVGNPSPHSTTDRAPKVGYIIGSDHETTHAKQSIRELFQDFILPNNMVLFENFVKLLAQEPIYRATYADDAVIVKRLRTDPQYSELFQTIDASDPHLTPAIVRQYTTQLRDILIQMNGIMSIGNGGPIRATWHRLCQQLQLPRQDYRIVQDGETILANVPQPIQEEGRIGEFVRSRLFPILMEPDFPETEVESLQNVEYSNRVLGINFPLLSATGQPRERYWRNPIAIRNTDYYVCSQWYERHRERVQQWIENHSPA